MTRRAQICLWTTFKSRIFYCTDRIRLIGFINSRNQFDKSYFMSSLQVGNPLLREREARRVSYLPVVNFQGWISHYFVCAGFRKGLRGRGKEWEGGGVMTLLKKLLAAETPRNNLNFFPILFSVNPPFPPFFPIKINFKSCLIWDMFTCQNIYSNPFKQFP